MEHAVHAHLARGVAVRVARGARSKDARALARELLAMTQEEFSAAFNSSPMHRRKLRGLKRHAALVLGNVGTAARDHHLDGLAAGHRAVALLHAIGVRHAFDDTPRLDGQSVPGLSSQRRKSVE